MHGKMTLLEKGYAGIDEQNLYCRVDFIEPASEWASPDATLLVAIETVSHNGRPDLAYRLQAEISGAGIGVVKFGESGHTEPAPSEVRASMQSIFECQVPLTCLHASEGTTLRVRFSLWRDRLPLDALPQEGAIELRVASESELSALPYARP